MTAPKLFSLDDAVARFVEDGFSLLMGAGLEAQIPFAAGQEIIRQKRRDLTLIAPISDILIDQLVGAGVVRKVVAAWVGNVSAGLGHNFRRAVEQGLPHKLQVVDHSNLTLATALHAAALGVPFLPTYTTLGTDILAANPDLIETQSPFTAERLVAVRALSPDVAILPVQKADAQGNCHVWGNLGVIPDGARAAKRVIVTAEEIVPGEVISTDPNRTVIPGFLVSAVVHEPFGCHPSPCLGYYGRDHRFFSDYHEETRFREGFDRWLERWVRGVKDRREYLEQLGEERIQQLSSQQQTTNSS